MSRFVGTLQPPLLSTLPSITNDDRVVVLSTNEGSKYYFESAAEWGQLTVNLTWKVPVRVAATSNINTSTPGATIDDVALTSGDRMLLVNQTTGSQNGIYLWSGAASALVRSKDADTTALLTPGSTIYIREGTNEGGNLYVVSNTTAITVGTTTVVLTKHLLRNSSSNTASTLVARDSSGNFQAGEISNTKSIFTASATPKYEVGFNSTYNSLDFNYVG